MRPTPLLFGALLAAAAGCTPAPTPEPSQLETPPVPEDTPAPDRRDTSTPAARAHVDQTRACVAAAGSLEPAAAGVVKAFCSDVINAGVPGAAMVLRTPGGERVALTHGVRCNGASEPVRLDTPFRLASLSKPLTALAVLRLVETGALDLSDPLARHLPELRGATWGTVTLEQLLTHTAGLPDQRAVAASSTADGGPTPWLTALVRLPADAGSARGDFRYSNLGYDLLGEVVGRVDDRGWASVLQATVLDPLGLAHATADDRAPTSSPAACGHLAPTSPGIPVGADERLTHADHPWKRPSGGALGSVLDLERLALAVGAASAESNDPLERALAHSLDGAIAVDRGQSQSLAWRRLPGSGSAVYRHTGALGHFTAELYFSSDGGFVLAYAANTRHELRGTVAAALQGFTGATLVQ